MVYKRRNEIFTDSPGQRLDLCSGDIPTFTIRAGGSAVGANQVAAVSTRFPERIQYSMKKGDDYYKQ